MVGKRFNVSERKLKKLYEETKKKTHRFKKIDPWILAENSQRLIVFRLALKLSIEKFAKMCSRARGSIQNLEKESKTINYKVAKYYTEIINKNFDKMDTRLNSLLKTYKKFRERALKGVKTLTKEQIKEFAKLGSREARKKLTPEKLLEFSHKGVIKQKLTLQEERVKNLLKKVNIAFESHKYIEGENFDFVVKNNRELILIGCSAGKKKNLAHHARRLMYQAYRIKYKMKNTKYIAILGDNDNSLKPGEVPLSASKLLNEIVDAWFVDENLNDMINLITSGF